MSRRRFLLRALLAAFGLGVAGVGYSTLLEPHWIMVTRRRIRIPGLAPPLVGRTLAHLTDLHLGIAPAHYVERCVDRTLELRPDMIALTGDFVGTNRIEEAEAAARILGRLAAPLGVYAVSGNHDFGVYRAGAPTSEPLVLGLLEEEGVRILDREAIPFEGEGSRTWLVGLGDLWAGRCRVEETMSRLPRDEPRIVLSHNPDSIPRIAAAGADLVLSGHTHGGQIDIPVLGPPRLPVRLRQYYSGLYRIGDRTRLYVSNGLGYLIRVRFNARPEIALHTLDRSA
ncbi:MAG: metallophosphoesterase [Planctomycetota bacterium]